MMPMTPDRAHGVSDEEAVIMERTILATVPGELRFDDATGRWSLFDDAGEYDPRDPSGSMPSATQVGQVLSSCDGLTFAPELPVTNAFGWMVNEEGILIVNG